MNKKISSILEYTGYSLIAAFYLFGCDKNETVKTSPLKPEVVLGERSNTAIVHLYSDTVYILNVNFVRNAGQELVIDEGTLIKVQSTQGTSDIGSIVVQPGGVIKVNGSRNKPVVFTSRTYTGTQGYNWGGITINGKAKNNTRGNSGDTTDFSGSLTFMRIEFAPLVLDAVGSKTIIENVMVSYTGKSVQSPAENSFKISGGSFNARNLVSYACGGPADFYITNGYNGKLQNMLAYRNPLFGAIGNLPENTLAGVFISNNENGDATAEPNTFPIVSNLTVLGPNGIKGSSATYLSANRTAALIVDYNAAFSIRNSLLLGFPGGGIFVADASTAANIETGKAVISTTYFHANDSAHTFYLADGVYPPNNSYTLANVLLDPVLKNVKYASPVSNTSDFGFADPFNYNNPNLVPKDISPVLSGADFSGPLYDTFFIAVNNIGAVGKDNWLTGWTNFIPLKTNYNIPDFKPF